MPRHSQLDANGTSEAKPLAYTLHQVMLRWLILLGVIAASLCVLWDQGLIMKVLDSDRSRISLVIMAIFAATTAHASYRAWQISHEDNVLSRLIRAKSFAAEVPFLSDSAVAVYLRAVARRTAPVQASASERTGFAEALSARLKGGQELGWLIADLMFKLGLLGTVVGFVFMLGSIVDIDSLDIKTMQYVLLRMSDGMRVALYTTMTGLAGGMLLGIQYHFLDRAAEGVLIRVKECGELGLDSAHQISATADS